MLFLSLGVPPIGSPLASIPFKIYLLRDVDQFSKLSPLGRSGSYLSAEIWVLLEPTPFPCQFVKPALLTLSTVVVAPFLLKAKTRFSPLLFMPLPKETQRSAGMSITEDSVNSSVSLLFFLSIK